MFVTLDKKEIISCDIDKEIKKDKDLLSDTYSNLMDTATSDIKVIVHWWFLSSEIYDVLYDKYTKLGIFIPKEFDKYFSHMLKSRRKKYVRISSRFALRESVKEKRSSFYRGFVYCFNKFKQMLK